MSLFPGATRVSEGKNVLDDVALANSMAIAMEEEMGLLLQSVKGETLPNDFKEDRRILFAAVARGLLRYLRDHQGALRAQVVVNGNGAFTVEQFNLNVTMDTHSPH